jgi:hypothetical protein
LWLATQLAGGGSSKWSGSTRWSRAGASARAGSKGGILQLERHERIRAALMAARRVAGGRQHQAMWHAATMPP